MLPRNSGLPVRVQGSSKRQPTLRGRPGTRAVVGGSYRRSRSRCRHSARPAVKDLIRLPPPSCPGAVLACLRSVGSGLLVILPHLPGCVALCIHFVQRLFFLERIHGEEGPFMRVCEKLASGDESTERFFDKFFSRLYVVEYFLPEYEIASVDPRILPFTQCREICDNVVLTDRGHMKTACRPRCHERSHLVGSNELLNHVIKRHVGQSIRIVGKEHFLALQIFSGCE